MVVQKKALTPMLSGLLVTSNDLFPLCDHVEVELREQRDVRQHDGNQNVVEVEGHVEAIGHRPREDLVSRHPGQADVAAPQLPGDSDGVQGKEQCVPENDINKT